MPKPQTQNRIGAWIDDAMILTFLGCLLAPLLVMLVSSEDKSLEGGPRPNWQYRHVKELFSFPLRYREYFQDHFGLRKRLIQWHGWFKVNLLGVSSSAKVILGKDGWLFYTGENGGEVEDCRGLKPFTPSQLAEWERLITVRRQWLQDRGIPLFILLAPNKSTIQRVSPGLDDSDQPSLAG
jgi:hypothetical protein